MSAGMADVIAEHNVIYEPPQIGDCGRVEIPSYHYCQCCAAGTCFDSPQEHAAHVAEELAKAGYGNVQEAKAEAVRETAIDWAAYQSARMPRSDVLQVPVWLNQRAAKMEAPHGVD